MITHFYEVQEISVKERIKGWKVIIPTKSRVLWGNLCYVTLTINGKDESLQDAKGTLWLEYVSHKQSTLPNIFVKLSSLC